MQSAQQVLVVQRHLCQQMHAAGNLELQASKGQMLE